MNALRIREARPRSFFSSNIELSSRRQRPSRQPSVEIPGSDNAPGKQLRNKASRDGKLASSGLNNRLWTFKSAFPIDSATPHESHFQSPISFSRIAASGAAELSRRRTLRQAIRQASKPILNPTPVMVGTPVLHWPKILRLGSGVSFARSPNIEEVPAVPSMAKRSVPKVITLPE